VNFPANVLTRAQQAERADCVLENLEAQQEAWGNCFNPRCERLVGHTRRLMRSDLESTMEGA
jgi:hypothetical protein